jgi:hypothetical protein
MQPAGDAFRPADARGCDRKNPGFRTEFRTAGLQLWADAATGYGSGSVWTVAPFGDHSGRQVQRGSMAKGSPAYFGFTGMIEPEGVGRIAGALNSAVNGGRCRSMW